MANKAKKDITGETALNAVEQALSVDFTESMEDIDYIEARIEDAASKVKKTTDVDNLNNSIEIETENHKQPPESLASFDDIKADQPAPPPAPANDEVNSELASLIYAIQQKPKSKTFLITSVITLIWLAACAYYGYQNILPNIPENFTTSSLFSSTSVLAFTAITFLPLLPLWAFAILVKRSQEMRHAANSMTEAAIQLLQPETAAKNSVATVGRAIRREVSAIGDGVERAIARAGELEFMVQKEVMNLERSYGDSEVRLRSLVDEIGTERETMVKHADRLQSAISSTHTSLTSDIESVSNKVEEKLRMATMSMSDTFAMRSDTITTNLTETSEGLINLLAMAGENLNQQLFISNKDLSNNLELSTNQMASAITTNGKAVARLLETRTAGLQQVTALVDERLEISKKEFETSFNEKTENLSSIMKSAGQSVNNLLRSASSEVADQSNTTIQKIEDGRVEFRKQMSEQTVEFANMINTGGQSVKEIIDLSSADNAEYNRKIIEEFEASRIAFKEDLSSRSITIAQSLTQVSNAVISNMDASVADTSEHNRKIIKEFEESRIAFKEDLSSRSITIAQSLTQVSSAVISNMETSAANTSEHGRKIIKEFEDSRIAFKEDLSSGSNNIAQALSHVSDKVISKMEISADEFEKRGDQITQQIGDNLSVRASEFASQLNESGEKVETSLQNQLNSIDTNMTTKGESLVNALSMRTDALDKVLHERTDGIGKTIGERLSGFGQVLTNQVDGTVEKLQNQVDSLQKNTKSVEEIITTKTKKVEDAVNSSTIRFANVIEQSLEATNKKSAEVNAALNQTSTNLNDALNQTSAEINTNLNQTSAKLNDALNQTSTDINASLNQTSSDLIGSMDQSSSQLTDKLETTTKILTGALDSTASNLTQKIGNTTEELNQAIAKNKDEFSSKIDEEKIGFVNALNAQTNLFTNTIDGTTEIFSKAIEERANNLSAKLSQGAHQIATSLDEKSKAAADRMETSVKVLDERLAENTNTIENHFAAGNQILEENLTKGKNSLLNAISQSLNDVGHEIDNKAEKISDLLTDRANIINDKLGSSLVETQRNLEAKTEELNAILANRTSELSGLIDSEAKPVINSIIDAGNETSLKLANLSKLIGEEANLLFANIGNSSGLLEKLIEDASGNLDMMQNSLSSQIQNFSNAVETTKYNVSQSETIASDLNDKLQNTSNDMLIGIGGIAQRFEAQSIILTDATHMIDAAQNNLEATLEGKQDALQKLATGLVSHSDQINTNMISFNTVVSSMIEDASAKSKNISGSISADITTAIEDATSRFDVAVNAMRSAANTMRQELEDTREQMRRGILELPDETEKNASAMRRVVTDQIAALRDLSAIVEKSGKSFDASPALKSQPAQQPQQTAAAAYIAKPTPQVATPAQASPAVNMALRGTQSTLAQQTLNKAPVQASTASPKSSGWVSDLLRRASEEERAPAVNVADRRSPNQVVESLNSLSVDIANAIDHETSVELWDRYQRGETNVFTRRLYTLQGQQTFDEIRNKYTRDSEFRAAVNRYINDFEQLLNKETSNGQNQTLSQSYLTSDTGKVYTMLAHASGRLGNQV